MVVVICSDEWSHEFVSGWSSKRTGHLRDGELGVGGDAGVEDATTWTGGRRSFIELSFDPTRRFRFATMIVMMMPAMMLVIVLRLKEFHVHQNLQTLLP